MTPAVAGPTRVPVVVVGAGFGGLAVGRALVARGIDCVLLEKAHDVGGVWRDNTYPGAACDVASHLYSYSFARRYPWTRRFARQPEILAYLRRCAEHFGLASRIRFGHEVTRAAYDAHRGLWRVECASGEVFEARLLVSSVGQLHRPVTPALPGLASFRGEAFHSARWDHSARIDGADVAVVGTGASAVQFVPELARRARNLWVLQRSPGWVAPKADPAISPLARQVLDRVPALQDLDRLWFFALTEFLGASYRGHALLSLVPKALAHGQLHRQVPSPELRARLTPDYPIGCKRILLSDEWLPTFSLPHVELVTEPIARVEAHGLRLEGGRELPAQVMVFGTGFAATELLAPMQVVGREGRELTQSWRGGAAAYLGMTVPSFPNFFVLYGPNTNLGSGSIVFVLEQQAEHVAEVARELVDRGARSVEVRRELFERFVGEVRERSKHTVYDGNCSSWYKNAEGVNTNTWVGSMLEYRRRARRPRWGDYVFEFGARGTV